MHLSPRQSEIIELVRTKAPITGEQIADQLGLTRPAIRADLVLLVMLKYIDAKPKVGYTLGTEKYVARTGTEQVFAIAVKDAMGAAVNLRDHATVTEAIATLFLENVGSIVVTDAAGALVGIVSRKDLLKVTMGNPQSGTMLLSLVMTRYPNIATVSPEDTVLDAMRKMIEHEIDGLPVVQKLASSTTKIEAVGRITKTTILKLFYESALGDM